MGEYERQVMVLAYLLGKRAAQRAMAEERRTTGYCPCCGSRAPLIGTRRPFDPRPARRVPW